MVPILTSLAAHSEPGYNPAILFSFYLPYLILPLTLMIKLATGGELVFDPAGSKAKTS
jgi:hypothetical protein